MLALYRRLRRWPAGNWLFTRMVCWRAPYFGTIRPLFIDLKPGYASARMRKRRGVQNHIGTVHAIAMANLCELVAGTMTEVTVPATMRWIPRRMTIEYLGKATTDVVARAQPEAVSGLSPPAGAEHYTFEHDLDLPVAVEVSDRDGKIVVRAVITMWVSARPARNA